MVYSIVVFFFKQKTAYEMRISDWSSDVCSSDLLRKDRIAVAPEAEALPVLHRQILLRLGALHRRDVGRVVETGELCRCRARAVDVGVARLTLRRKPAEGAAEVDAGGDARPRHVRAAEGPDPAPHVQDSDPGRDRRQGDRKSTRLNSSQ